MKFIWLSLCLLFTAVLSAQPALFVEPYQSGFSNPVDITHCGDDRLFVVEKTGQIRIITGNGTLLPTPFLNLMDSVSSNGNEQGLLGLAFHPDYQNNGFFYVYFTQEPTEQARLYRYSVDANDDDRADPQSGVFLMEIPQNARNHNGGCLKFGPDGYLYISSGDGGGSGDPLNLAQNPLDRRGKMLRIDVDQTDPGLPYAIPVSNPFTGAADTLDEIWSLGLRNPWRFSFDRQTGDMYIGDVGQADREEINYEPAGFAGGANYGWRCYEGELPETTTGCQPQSAYDAPIHTYESNDPIGRSVTGGFVYRGDWAPTLQGKYLYGDFVSGRIWALDRDGGGQWFNEELLDWTNFQLSAFGENAAGELFLAGHNNNIIYRVRGDVCAPSQTLNNQVLAEQTYRAETSIETNGTVETGAFSALVAGQHIRLQAGFHAEAGSAFLATVSPNTTCPSNNPARLQLPSPIPLRQLTTSLLRISPNPSNDHFQLTGWADGPVFSHPLPVQLISPTGRVLRTYQLLTSNQNFSLDEVPPGLYFIQLETPDQGWVTLRLVRQ